MKKFCVIGDPIEHSKSPQLHQAAFQEFHIQASFEKVRVRPEVLPTWLEKEALAYEGIAVTIPHKEAVLPLLPRLTTAAKRIGAVNTLYRDPKNPESFIGTNTDCIGALKALQTVTNPEGKRVLVLGAGGASRAIIFGLLMAKARITLWNRTQSKALELAEAFSVTPAESLAVINPKEIDIVINTTSVGMKEWRSLIPEDFWLPQHTAFDIVYTPLETKFLADAAARGAKTVTGDKMLVYQAVEQFRIWHGIEVEAEIMERAFFLD